MRYSGFTSSTTRGSEDAAEEADAPGFTCVLVATDVEKRRVKATDGVRSRIYDAVFRA